MHPRVERLERRVVIRATLADVWRFFSDPRNLPRITPTWLDLRIVSPVPEAIYPGLILEYRVRPLGWLEWQWVTEITHLREGRLFVDEQRFGPYRFWHHQHHFHEVREGVEVRDVVHYVLPGGALGRWVLGSAVASRLREIFDYREAAVRRILGDPGP
ncbi:MAG: SRPBCC family protein [Armatimonadota bacterium]|nr:SRPBCC family protein [Armatimonadota bacterium]MDW8155690.1 SRPBCC family protein [Armatimonadota bacterium]